MSELLCQRLITCLQFQTPPITSWVIMQLDQAGFHFSFALDCRGHTGHFLTLNSAGRRGSLPTEAQGHQKGIPLVLQGVPAPALLSWESSKVSCLPAQLSVLICLPLPWSRPSVGRATQKSTPSLSWNHQFWTDPVGQIPAPIPFFLICAPETLIYSLIVLFILLLLIVPHINSHCSTYYVLLSPDWLLVHIITDYFKRSEVL